MAALIVFLAHADQLNPQLAEDDKSVPWQDTDEFAADLSRSRSMMDRLLLLISKFQLMPDLKQKVLEEESIFRSLADKLNGLSWKGREERCRIDFVSSVR